MLDPERASAALAEATAEALSSCDRTEIAAVGVTAQRSGVVLLDADGREIFSGPNADGRAIMEGLAQEREHGPLIYRTAGRLPAMLYFPARLAWIRANRPEVFERAHAALSFSDWVVWRLTGEVSTDPTQAAEMLVYDVSAGAWSPELISALEVPAALLPRIVVPGTAAGSVRGDAFGFLPGTPVVPAGADTQCAALGMGVVEPGDAIVVAGTTMLCEKIVDAPVLDPAGRLWTSPHATPGRFVQEAHCGESGAAVDWTAGLLGISADQMGRESADGVPGAGGVGFFDSFPSNASDFGLVRMGGWQFPVPLLALGRGRPDVARAVFEGIAFGACAGLDWLSEAGGEPASLSVCGGVSRAETFVATLAGVAGREVRVANEEHSSGLGAAIAAAADHFGGVKEAADAMCDRGRRVAPRDDDGYPSLYAAWRERAAVMEASATRIGQLL